MQDFFLYQVDLDLCQGLFQFLAGGFKRLLTADRATFEDSDAFGFRFFSQLNSNFFSGTLQFSQLRSLASQAFFSRCTALNKSFNPLLQEFGSPFRTLPAAPLSRQDQGFCLCARNGVSRM